MRTVLKVRKGGKRVGSKISNIITNSLFIMKSIPHTSKAQSPLYNEKNSRRGSQDLIFKWSLHGAYNLRLAQLAQAADGGADGDGGSGGRDVSSTSDDLVATSASPDTDIGALDGVLTAELAGVLSVLGNFDLADLLTDGRTVASSVLSNDTDLLSSASLLFIIIQNRLYSSETIQNTAC